jgi:AraC family transcriptional regulator, melibiose operon regulatory protein
VSDIGTRDGYARETVLLEMEARLRRHTAVRRPVPLRGSGDQFERLAHHVSEHCREPLSVAGIGAAVGLHPNYASTLFKSRCGIGLWDYVLHLRLSQAQRLLLTSDLSVDRIAVESGFGSRSSFYAAFRKVSEPGPRAYRRRKSERAGMAVEPPA